MGFSFSAMAEKQSSACDSLKYFSQKVQHFAYSNLDSCLHYASASRLLFQSCDEIKEKATVYAAIINTRLLRAEYDEARKGLKELELYQKANEDFFLNQVYYNSSSRYYTYINELDSAKYYIDRSLKFSAGSDYEPILKLQRAIVDYYSGEVLTAYAVFLDLMRLYDDSPYAAMVDVYAQLYAGKVYAQINEYELTGHLLDGAYDSSSELPILRALVAVEQSSLALVKNDLSLAENLLDMAKLIFDENSCYPSEYYFQSFQLAYLENNQQEMSHILTFLQNKTMHSHGEYFLASAKYKSTTTRVDEVVDAFRLAVLEFDKENNDYKSLVSLNLCLRYLNSNGLVSSYQDLEKEFISRDRKYRAKRIPLRIRDLEADYNLSMIDRDLKQVQKEYELSVKESSMLRSLLFVLAIALILLALVIRITLKRTKERAAIEELKIKQQQLIIENKSLINSKSKVNIKNFIDELVQLNELRADAAPYEKLLKKYNLHEKIDAEWKEYIEAAYETNAALISSLAERGVKLSKAELRLISLLQKELSSSQIAKVLNIQTNSVEKARSRLRKKMNLPSGADLLLEIKKIV